MSWIRNRLPMAIPPVQVPLPLGFWTEPQKTAAPRKRQRTPAGSESREVHPPMQPRGAVTGLDAPEAFEVRIDGMRLVNPLNGSQGTTRGAMFAESTRRKRQRGEAFLKVKYAVPTSWHQLVRASSFKIAIIRIAPGKFDDDNLRASCKSVRDGIADALGFRDDSAPGLAWDYLQMKGASRTKLRPAEYAVIIRIERLPAPAIAVSARSRPRARKKTERLRKPNNDRQDHNHLDDAQDDRIHRDERDQP